MCQFNFQLYGLNTIDDGNHILLFNNISRKFSIKYERHFARLAWSNGEIHVLTLFGRLRKPNYVVCGKNVRNTELLTKESFPI